MRALITGAFGFVGHYLAEHLESSGDQVLRTSLLPNQGEQLDITNLEQCRSLLAKHKPNWVFHLAGISFAPDAERDFSAAIATNVQGTFNLLKSCEELGAPVRVLVASSAEVYGRINSVDLPIKESLKPNPANNYSLSKLMVEDVANYFNGRGGVETVVARAFNHIGPGQRPDFVVPAFASQLAAVSRKEKEAVIRVGNLDAKRDFSDVRDVVRGYRLALEKGSGTYNFCSGKAVSIQSILDQLVAISKLDVRIESDPTRMRKAEVPEIYGSYEKAKKEIGWEPEFTNLGDSLSRIYQSLL